MGLEIHSSMSERVRHALTILRHPVDRSTSVKDFESG